MKNRDYGYFGKGLTGYAQYMTAFKRNQEKVFDSNAINSTNSHDSQSISLQDAIKNNNLHRQKLRSLQQELIAARNRNASQFEIEQMEFAKKTPAYRVSDSYERLKINRRKRIKDPSSLLYSWEKIEPYSFRGPNNLSYVISDNERLAKKVEMIKERLELELEIERNHKDSIRVDKEIEEESKANIRASNDPIYAQSKEYKALCERSKKRNEESLIFLKELNAQQENSCSNNSKTPPVNSDEPSERLSRNADTNGASPLDNVPSSSMPSNISNPSIVSTISHSTLKKSQGASSVPSIEEFVEQTKNTTPSPKSDEITTAQIILWIILGALGFGLAIGAVIGAIMLLLTSGAIGVILAIFVGAFAWNIFFKKH